MTKCFPVGVHQRLSADTEDDFVVGTTYTERTPALKESDADEGRLELSEFGAEVQVAESSSTEIPSDEENEARLHLWYGDYSTDLRSAGVHQIPAIDPGTSRRCSGMRS